MYNFKLPKSERSPNKEKDPFGPDILRIWIVTGGTFLALFGMIEAGGSFRSNSPALTLIVVFIGLLYVMDALAESYKVIRYIFIVLAVVLSMISLGLGIEMVRASLFLTFLYGMIAAVLAFNEYEI